MNPVLHALMGPAASVMEAVSQRRYLAVAKQHELTTQLQEFDSEFGKEIQEKQSLAKEAAKQVSDIEADLAKVNLGRSQLFPLILKQGSLIGKLLRWLNELCSQGFPMIFQRENIELRTLADLTKEEDLLKATIRDLSEKLARARAHRQHTQQLLSELTTKRDRIAKALASEIRIEEASIKQTQDQLLDRISHVDIRFLAESLGHCPSASPKVIRDILRLRHQRRLNELIRVTQTRVEDSAADPLNVIQNRIVAGFSESVQRSATQLRLTGRGHTGSLRKVPLLSYTVLYDFLKTSSWSADHLAKGFAKHGFENIRREANTVGLNAVQSAKSADTRPFLDLLRVTGLERST